MLEHKNAASSNCSILSNEIEYPYVAVPCVVYCVQVRILIRPFLGIRGGRRSARQGRASLHMTYISRNPDQ